MVVLTSGVRDDKSSDGMTSCSPFLMARSSLSTQPIITLVAYNLDKKIIIIIIIMILILLIITITIIILITIILIIIIIIIIIII